MRTSSRYVDVQGPDSDFDRRSGDEIPVWTVCISDEDGEPIGTVYNVYSLEKARGLGRKMAQDRRLPLNDESSPA